MWYIHAIECYSATKGSDVLMHATRREVGLIPMSGRSAGVGNGNPLQHSSLRNTRDRGAWWTAVLGVTKSWKWLSTHTRNRMDIENMLMEISQNRKKNYLWFRLYEMDFPGGSDGKASAHNAGDLGLIPGLGRSPGEGKGYPLQCSVHNTDS